MQQIDKRNSSEYVYTLVNKTIVNTNKIVTIKQRYEMKVQGIHLPPSSTYESLSHNEKTLPLECIKLSNIHRIVGLLDSL